MILVNSVLVCSSNSLATKPWWGLACWKEACRFCPIITKVDRKIASRETMSVRVGQGLFSNTSIHTTKTPACRYTNLIEPAKAVIVSATRSWSLAERCSATARNAGCCGFSSWVLVICGFLASLSIADEQESHGPVLVSDGITDTRSAVGSLSSGSDPGSGLGPPD